jgi:endonuclease YncB( thermonuclease family)
MSRRLLVASIWVLLTGSTTALVEDRLIGQASVIDGDTIEIHGKKIRLEGIDAPESRQTCIGRDSRPWSCGKASAFALAEKIGTKIVTCQPKGKDRYKRVLAVCYLSDRDLNSWMVRNGWSVAYRRYSKAYIGVEEIARANKINIWSGTFRMPWDWRKSH